MSEEHIDRLTRQHSETRARLELQEARARTMRWTALTALLGALGAGGGGGYAYLADDAEDDDFKTALAVHVVQYESWRADAGADIDELIKQAQVTREAIIRLQAAVESLSERHRDSGGEGLRQRLEEVERALEEAQPAPRAPHSVRGDDRPAPESVQRVKGRLFAD